MNTKKVKRIRKQLGYHPTDKRQYKAGVGGGVILANCSRVAYQLMEQVKGA